MLMLRAFLDTSQDDEPIEPSPGEVMFLVDRKLCLITDDGYDLPAEFVRIPLSVALSFADRDSTRWIQPDTATQGQKELSVLMTKLSNDMNKTRAASISSASSLMDETSSRISLMDKSRYRQRKRERMMRWSQ